MARNRQTDHGSRTRTDKRQDRDRRAEWIITALREAGGRVTVPRRAVIDALLSGGDHPTAENLALDVQRDHPEVAVSTVYRILDQLEHIGVLVHVHLGHGAAVYHFADDAHVHLVCAGCGITNALPHTVGRRLAATIRDSSGFTADLSHFSISGWCEECAAQR